ncbi:unnamed protein product, partial [Effrenium voratum]
SRLKGILTVKREEQVLAGEADDVNAELGRRSKKTKCNKASSVGSEEEEEVSVSECHLSLLDLT